MGLRVRACLCVSGCCWRVDRCVVPVCERCQARRQTINPLFASSDVLGGSGWVFVLFRAACMRGYCLQHHGQHQQLLWKPSCAHWTRLWHRNALTVSLNQCNSVMNFWESSQYSFAWHLPFTHGFHPPCNWHMMQLLLSVIECNARGAPMVCKIAIFRGFS